MENKINIAELLKDCPQGMELNCLMFDNVTLLRVDDREDVTFPIILLREDGNSVILTKYGQCTNANSAKCVIFPKGKTTWDGFQRPFKDGDIVYVKSNKQNEYIVIFKEIKNDHIHKYVCFAYQHLSIDKCALCHLVDAEIMRLATEEEKQRLFDAIKANGYKWNEETKTLEKLVEPRFKVGDRIKSKYKNFQYDVKWLNDTHYTLVEVEDKFQYTEPIIEDKNWELVPNKFDINTLKPFDKVLVRCSTLEKWRIQFFEKYDKTYQDPFICIGYNKYKQCIPYEANEHLLGTTDDCEDYYKTW